MVGKYIRAAEQRLGARLLHRTTRRQTLTDVGALYYERCKQVLAEVDLADRTASELQSDPRGMLRIVAPVGFGARCLTPVIAEYLNRHPDVQVELTLDNGRPDLIGGGYELGIQMGDVSDDSLIARPLRPYRRILAASPQYVSHHGVPSHPSELKRHVCLGLSYWRHSDLWCLERPGGERCEVKVRGRFTANHGEALRQAAICGVGIVLQPEVLLAEDIASGRLVPILPDWSFVPTPMYLVYAQDCRPSAKMRSVIDFLLDTFQSTNTIKHLSQPGLKLLKNEPKKIDLTGMAS
jgi:DNA-binding transcriptional LysR family regulator